MQFRKQVSLCTLLLFVFTPALSGGELPKAEQLHGHNFESKIRYPDGETVREAEVRSGAPSGRNRVFSDVETPMYFLHQADPQKATGVGLVICPGGGYRDVWLDREGHDLAIWLKQFGITSLVLKYRTNGNGDIDGRKYAWKDYMPAVINDSAQAVRVLRGRANEVNVDPARIGICGFSAGGNLAMHLYLLAPDPMKEQAVSHYPDWAGLFYPWFRTDEYQKISQFRWLSESNMFIVNAADDEVTPSGKCLDFYRRVFEKGGRPELHIVNKGGHGFDLGEGRGESVALWKRSFVAWLTDRGLMKKANWQNLKPIGFSNSDKIVADILDDNSIQFDPNKIYAQQIRFAFEEPVTLRQIKMELLPSKETPRVGWEQGDKQRAPFIWEVKPFRVSADGDWFYLDVRECVYPTNPDYQTDTGGPHAMADYLDDSGFRSPTALPGQDAVEFILELRNPVVLKSGDEFLLKLSAGSRDGYGDGFGRVRFSFLKE